MPGIRIRHHTLRSCVALVPLMHKPLVGASLDECPSCHVIHPVKTVHLWLDDSGSCIVSKGVLKDLREAGMPDLDTLEEVKKPPPLHVGESREKQDQEARTVTVGRR